MNKQISKIINKHVDELAYHFKEVGWPISLNVILDEIASDLTQTDIVPTIIKKLEKKLDQQLIIKQSKYGFSMSLAVKEKRKK